MSRVVVVGAGVGGLAATARLCALGHEVTLVEQAGEVGGKLGTLRRDGFVFDTGPSLLTLPDVLEELYAATGAPLSQALPLQRLETACHYRFADGTLLDLPGDPARIPDALDAALGTGRGEQWAGLMARAGRIWDITREPFLESPLTTRQMLRLSYRLGDVATVAPWRTLRGLAADHLHDPRLRALLDRYATYTGSDPRRAPAALVTVPYAEQTFGSWYVPGGLGRLATSLLERVRAQGAQVLLDTEVVEVLVHDGRAAGVRLADDSVLEADVVVANADAASVYGRLLPGRVARRSARRIRRTTPSLSGLALLLAVDDPPEVAHHQVLFAEDYDAEFDAVFGRHGPPRPVERPTVYVSAPRDPAVVPEAGTGAWFVLVNAPRHDPRHGVDWDEPGLAEDQADRVLDLMAERGLDVRSRVRHRTLVSPADLERRTLTPGGSIYGTSSNGARAAFQRPANRSPLPGLYLVGGSSHPGGGLPLVVLSARIVAGLVGPA
ncbi:phytoene desaturase family protein [Nocardioides rubriscoriae]|uniref:phytoene desaturase family protein n=1 Tax=Nocardioides rubriscoriae TaxID=642762 RepID=UPI0011DF81EF|nr:phytoene desaturase family protein [Nocardioides rubriscoriae]